VDTIGIASCIQSRQWRHSSIYSTLIVDGDEWSALRPAPLNPGGKVPARHPVDRKLDETYSSSGHRDDENNRRMSSSGMWSCVDLALADVSEERIASIFRVEESAKVELA
jgi:hypothetical protein